MHCQVLLIVFLGVFLTHVAAEEKKVVCYYTNWAVYRQGDGKYDTSNVDPSLCTHIIYSFIQTNDNGDIVNSDVEGLKNFLSLREKCPGVKLMVAMGGWNQGSNGFSAMTSNPQTRQKFVQNAANFLKEYKLDGLDLDWEYPNKGGSNPAEKANYAQWVHELSQKFRQENLLLSAAVAAGQWQAGMSYDIVSISQDLDFINLMTYDFHGFWEQKTGLHSAIGAGPGDADPAANIESSLKFWTGQGADPQKLVLGVPFYGKGWKLQNPQNTDVGASTSGPSAAGKYTGEAGTLSYMEICENLKSGTWKSHYDETRGEAYAISDDGQWVGYDDKKTVSKKVDLIKKYNLGGGMAWSLDFDDFRGNCGEKNPLLTTLSQGLKGPSSSCEGASKSATIPPAPKPSLTQTAPSQPNALLRAQTYQKSLPPPEQPKLTSTLEVCQSAGLVRDPKHCNVFYQCVFNGKGYVAHKNECGPGLAFDDTIKNCNWTGSVKC